MNEMTVKGKLVRAEDMLEQVFAQNCRPSLRWLRTQTKAKTIPHVRIGHLVFFDVEMVRTHLAVFALRLFQITSVFPELPLLFSVPILPSCLRSPSACAVPQRRRPKG